MAWYTTIAKLYRWIQPKPSRYSQGGWWTILLDRESNEPYLVRYYLLSTRWLERWFPKLSYHLVLHNTLKSDVDGLHDHPWNWASRILSGGYWENTPEGRFWRCRTEGWRSRKGEDFHRLELDDRISDETWSLFLMGPRYKEWGFINKHGKWVQWKEYIDNRSIHL